jgi:hypothetical protein
MSAGLSCCVIAHDNPLARRSPRPEGERNAAYAGQFDWKTLFYDVYRVGDDIVFQGPPFFDFLPLLQQADPFQGKFGWLWPRARLAERNRANEIWLRDPRDRLTLDGAFGRFDIAVQPNLSDLFAGRRVIHTLSKNNDIRWIADWVRFYVAAHGADAVLIYDNASTAYSAVELQDALRAAFPNVVVVVQGWPFAYGPQGGLAGAVDGRETAWDSDYCQTGSMQHARFRYLLRARSVLNVDIDEMVLSDRGRSIFAVTEGSPHGFVKFPGAWISSANLRNATPQDCHHGDFVLRDRLEVETCPPKWCVVPDMRGNRKRTWSVHNLFGAKANRIVSDEFVYRHMKGISNNWKYDRWDAGAPDAQRFYQDDALHEAFVRTGLLEA